MVVDTVSANHGLGPSGLAHASGPVALLGAMPTLRMSWLDTTFQSRWAECSAELCDAMQDGTFGPLGIVGPACPS